MEFPGGSDGRESACNAGDAGSIPGSGRFPGEGNDYPLQYSCLENSMDRGAWWTTIYGVTESDTTEGLTLSISLTPRPQTGTWCQVHSLLGTRPHTGGEWWVGEQAKLHIYLQPLPSTCIIA